MFKTIAIVIFCVLASEDDYSGGTVACAAGAVDFLVPMSTSYLRNFAAFKNTNKSDSKQLAESRDRYLNSYSIIKIKH